MTVNGNSKSSLHISGFAFCAESCHDINGAGKMSEAEVVQRYQGITLDEMTDEDWGDVRLLATKHFHAGVFGGHQGKCWILAFTEFLEYQKKALIYEDIYDKIRVH